MGFNLPNGAKVFVGSELGDEIQVTEATNAKGAVFTVATGHGLAVDDVVIISSGWSLIDALVARVSAQTPTSVTIGIIDSTDVEFFEPGSGVGALRKVIGWTEIPQITEIATSGGDQQYTQIQFLSDDKQRNLATYKAAKTATYTLAHDSEKPIYQVLKTADRYGDNLPLRMFVPKAKETRYWSAKPSFDGEPASSVNNIETVQAAFSRESRDITFYKTKQAAPVSANQKKSNQSE